jgi:hypothetical protein
MVQTPETKRLTLRSFAPSDWAAVNATQGYPEATRYMHFAHCSTELRRHCFVSCVADLEEADVTGFKEVSCRDTAHSRSFDGFGTRPRLRPNLTMPGFGCTVPDRWFEAHRRVARRVLSDQRLFTQPANPKRSNLGNAVEVAINVHDPHPVVIPTPVELRIIRRERPESVPPLEHR